MSVALGESVYVAGVNLTSPGRVLFKEGLAA